MKKMKLIDLKNYCFKALQKAKIENPELNAQMILSHYTKIKRLKLPLQADFLISEETKHLIEQAVHRRTKHEPIQYILGETEFYGYKLLLNNSVLIPRPETELLVEKITKKEKDPQNILEIGTGSGAIAIALKKNLNEINLSATDFSKQALDIAIQNAEINKVKIDFFISDIFSKVKGKFDLIVSNPPYISQQDYKDLPVEVKDFEPRAALCAEKNGLYFYNQIIRNAKKHLTKNGKLYFEIGYDQAEEIGNIAKENGFGEVEVLQDLNNYDRIMRIE